MSASLRFLVVAVLAWGGVRAMTLDSIPGIDIATVAKAETAPPPPIVTTEFPPIDPPGAEFAYAYPPASAGYPLAGPVYPQFAQGQPVAPRYYRQAAYSDQRQAAEYPATYTEIVPEPAALFYSPIPQLDQWQVSRIAGTVRHDGRSSPVPAGVTPQFIESGRLDRLQLSAWALLRGTPGAGSLASGGTLGGSQAGARLSYAIDRRIAASLRTSSPVGGARGGEVAAGVRITPIPSIPVSFTAERRQSVGRGGGRSAFALFAETGLYQQRLPWKLSLDAYAQGGVVGVRSRDLFADGGLTIMRPLYGPVSLGLGTWGGIQPGLYRVDAGPRISMRVRRNMRVDLDWRQRVAGQAAPGSGPALTLAGNF